MKIGPLTAKRIEEQLNRMMEMLAEISNRLANLEDRFMLLNNDELEEKTNETRN
jgi:hypothetical protein